MAVSSWQLQLTRVKLSSCFFRRLSTVTGSRLGGLINPQEGWKGFMHHVAHAGENQDFSWSIVEAPKHRNTGHAKKHYKLHSPQNGPSQMRSYGEVAEQSTSWLCSMSLVPPMTRRFVFIKTSH